MLSYSDYAVNLLEENQDKIDWTMLSQNPGAIKLIEDNLNKIHWDYLSRNENAIHILEANIDKLTRNSWHNLSGSNLNAYKLFEKNINKICFEGIAHNESIRLIDIIKNNLDKIHIKSFLLYNNNPCGLATMINYHYETIKTHFYSGYGKELIEWIYHPNNMYKWGKDIWDLDI